MTDQLDATLRERALSSGDLTDAASTLVGSYTDKLNSVNTSGVIRQAGYMMLAATCGLLLYILLLRPRFGRQIAPKARKLFIKLARKAGKTLHLYGKQKDHPIKASSHVRDELDEIHDDGTKRKYFGRVQRGIIEFWDILTMSEDYHLMDCGLDSVAYLRILWMAFSIFFVISLITVPTLVPVDWKAHHPKETWTLATFEKASLNDFTIQGVKDNMLYYHIAALYAITLVVFGIVWWNCNVMSKLRVKYLTNPSYLHMPSDFYKRSAIIADLGPKSHDSRVEQIYMRKLRDPSSDLWLPHESHKERKERLLRESWKEMIQRKIHAKARKVLEHIDPNVVHPLELQANIAKVEVCVFDTPDPVGRQERMERRNELVKQLQYAITNHIKDETMKAEKLEIREPGLTALFRNKVEALTYYKAELVRSWTKINEQEHYYAVIGFPCAGYLSHFVQASNSLWSSWEVDYAPTSNGIIWPNIRANTHLRTTRHLAGYGILLILLVVYSGPITIIALLSNVSAVLVYFPDLSDWSQDHPTLFIALTTTVPPALSAVLFSMLPKIIHFIAYKQGAKTLRSLQSRIIHWYLAFVILAQLVIFPSLSTIFTLLTQKEVSEKSADATGLLKIWVKIVYFLTNIPTTYQTQANYWLNWLALRWFLAVFQLLQGPILAKKLLELIYRKLTARGKAIATAEPAEYAIHIPQAMFMLALGMIYAPMVPLIPVFLTVAMLILYSVHKVQALLLYHTESETLGRFWLPEMDRLLIFLALSQALLGLTTGLQGSSAKIGVMVLPAILCTVIYRFWLRAVFQPTLVDMLHPWAMHQTAKKHVEKQDLRLTYGFEPKGYKLEFEETVQEEAHKMLSESGLGRLLDIEDAHVEATTEAVIRNRKRAWLRARRGNIAATATAQPPVQFANLTGSELAHQQIVQELSQSAAQPLQPRPSQAELPASQLHAMPANQAQSVLQPASGGLAGMPALAHQAHANAWSPYQYLQPYAHGMLAWGSQAATLPQTAPTATAQSTLAPASSVERQGSMTTSLRSRVRGHDHPGSAISNGPPQPTYAPPANPQARQPYAFAAPQYSAPSPMNLMQRLPFQYAQWPSVAGIPNPAAAIARTGANLYRRSVGRFLRG